MFREKKSDIFSNLKNLLEKDKSADCKKIEEELEKINWKPNFKNSHGDTACHLLVRYNKWEMLENLINLGESLINQNKHGHTAIWLSRKKSEKMFGPLFLEVFNQAKKEGLLSDSLTHNPPSSVSKKSIEKPSVSTSSFKPKEYVYDETIEKMTILLKDNNHKELNIILLNDKFNINALNKSGNTFLHEVIALKDWDLAEEIINYGANVSLKNLDNKSCIDIINDDKENIEKDIYDMFIFAKKDSTIETSKINNESEVKTHFKGNKHQVKRNINKVNFIMSDAKPKEMKERNYLNTQLKSKSDTTIIVKKKRTSGIV